MPDRWPLDDQPADAASPGNGAVGGVDEARAQQIMAHAVGLAMQNAVHQQQQLYVLRNALTTAVAKAILQSSPDEALKLAKEVLSGEDIVTTLSGLKKLLDELNLKQPTESAKPAPGNSKPATPRPVRKAAKARRKTL